MNDYSQYRTLAVTEKQAITGVNLATAKVLLGLQISDIQLYPPSWNPEIPVWDGTFGQLNPDTQFDARLGILLDNAIKRVEDYTELAFSPRKHTLTFVNWDGEILLIGGNEGVPEVKDLSDVEITFTKNSKESITVKSDVEFTVSYTCGSLDIPVDISGVIYRIVDILWQVQDIAEQEKQIRVTLSTLRRYIRASRRL